MRVRTTPKPGGASRSAKRMHADPAKPRASPADLRDRLAQQRSFEGLHLMRVHGLSLTKAARQAKTTPRTMRRRVGQAFAVSPQGRIVATKFDRIPRTMRFITPQGLIDLTFCETPAPRASTAAIWQPADPFKRSVRRATRAPSKPSVARRFVWAK